MLIFVQFLFDVKNKEKSKLVSKSRKMNFGWTLKIGLIYCCCWLDLNLNNKDGIGAFVNNPEDPAKQLSRAFFSFANILPAVPMASFSVSPKCDSIESQE